MEISRLDIVFESKGVKYLQIYNRIKYMINSGQLSINDKLPTIRKLSSHLGVNNSTVVKAYELLENEGYISKKLGSGTFVSAGHSNDVSTKIENIKGVYRLDTGNPSTDMFPIYDFKAAINRAMDEENDSIFDYDDGNGIIELKEAIALYLCKLKIDAKPDNLMIISGAQQGIDIVCKSLINYSDVVFVEEPTYYGALNVLKSRGAKLVSIPLLEDGIDIGILRLKLEKIRPKLLYIMPNYQNPTGISYSEKKKKALIELAEEFGFYILEDDFISDFKFLSTNNRTLKSYDKYNRVIYIKSFSKILMPGLRVGVLNIPSELVNRTVMSKFSSDISTSTFIQKSLYHYMNDFDWEKHLKSVEKVYTERFIKVKEKLDSGLKDRVKLIKTYGGINFFFELNRGYYSRDFVNFMLGKGVALKQGAPFYDNEIDDRYVRLNIAREPMDRLIEAIDIIEENIDEFYSIFK